MDEELIIQSRDNCAVFKFGDSRFDVHPKGSLIAMADESDMISFKLQGSRKTIYSVLFSLISPSRATAAETVEALNEIL